MNMSGWMDGWMDGCCVQFFLVCSSQEISSSFISLDFETVFQCSVLQLIIFFCFVLLLHLLHLIMIDCRIRFSLCKEPQICQFRPEPLTVIISIMWMMMMVNNDDE